MDIGFKMPKRNEKDISRLLLYTSESQRMRLLLRDLQKPFFHNYTFRICGRNENFEKKSFDIKKKKTQSGVEPYSTSI